MFMDSNNQYFEYRYTTKFTDVRNEKKIMKFKWKHKYSSK